MQPRSRVSLLPFLGAPRKGRGETLGMSWQWQRLNSITVLTMKTIKGNEQGSILHSNNPTIFLKIAITRLMLVAKSLGVQFANEKKNLLWLFMNPQWIYKYTFGRLSQAICLIIKMLQLWLLHSLYSRPFASRFSMILSWCSSNTSTM